MAPTNLAHRRTHNLLLISKLLNLREHVSPFTLLLDSLEQPARPLIREYIRRANESKTHTIFISFETLKPPGGVDKFIPAWRYGENAPAEIAKQVKEHVADTAATSQTRRYILILDTTHPLSSLSLSLSPSPSPSPSPAFNLPTFLSSLLIPPSPSISISLLATHHLDIPSPSPSIGPSSSAPNPNPNPNPYAPTPLATLTYLATTLLTLHRPAHVLAARRAEERSLAAPVWGLEEGREGVVVALRERRRRGFEEGRFGEGGFSGEGHFAEGEVVVEMEHRRRSGRGVREWFFVRTSPTFAASGGKGKGKKPMSLSGGEGKSEGQRVVLLDDHPAFAFSAKGRTEGERKDGEGEGEEAEKELQGLTFDLGLTLTERQRREREGVVLPYFDAQQQGSQQLSGEGGRILYDMGVEDDFDEEEDEI